MERENIRKKIRLNKSIISVAFKWRLLVMLLNDWTGYQNSLKLTRKHFKF